MGSNFDDYLQAEGNLAEVEAAAVIKVIAYQIQEMMTQHDLSKSALTRINSLIGSK